MFLLHKWNLERAESFCYTNVQLLEVVWQRSAWWNPYHFPCFRGESTFGKVRKVAAHNSWVLVSDYFHSQTGPCDFANPSEKRKQSYSEIRELLVLSLEPFFCSHN